MAKLKPVKFSHITMTIEGESVIVNSDGKKYNLIEMIKPFINVENVNVKFNKAGKPREVKPVFKYKCPKCEKQVNSKEENLEAKCLDCNENFKRIK